MPIVMIFVIVFSLIVVGSAVKICYAKSKGEKTMTSEKISNSSRAEIEKMLKNIEKNEAPQPKMGAMCYEMAVPPEYREYICPIDGKKTVYARSSNVYWPSEQILEMRRLTEYLNTLTKLAVFKSDERRLCKKCTPKIEENARYVALVTTYPDGSEFVYNNIKVDDLNVLAGFFEKKLSYDSFNDSAEPLKNEIERIKKILGLKSDDSLKEGK